MTEPMAEPANGKEENRSGIELRRASMADLKFSSSDKNESSNRSIPSFDWVYK